MSTKATPDLYGYDEFIEQYLRDLTPMQRHKGLAPEERLKGLPPEERLTDLTEVEQVLALPIHLLRLLTQGRGWAHHQGNNTPGAEPVRSVLEACRQRSTGDSRRGGRTIVFQSDTSDNPF